MNKGFRQKGVDMRRTRLWGQGWLAALAFSAVWALGTVPALAQTAGNATIRGIVSDAQGGTVSGASVQLINEATKDVRKTTSEKSGGYVFVGVFPGTYTLKVEMAGFKISETKQNIIRPNDARAIDVKLELGQITDTLTVVAQVEDIQTETGAREGILNAKQIDNISIISRSPLELLRIMPGVVAPEQATMEVVGNGNGPNATGNYAVNGVRGSNNSVSLDGSRMIDIGSNSGVIITPNTDMVQEVKVQASNYAAEFGNAGVHVSAVTKGGSADFHGTVYTYARHNKLAANDRSRTGLADQTTLAAKRPETQYWYPGVNLSGPVLFPGSDFNKNKDKMFFFLAFEYQKQDYDSGANLAVVPTLLQRKGDFSEFAAGSPWCTSPSNQRLNQPCGGTLIPRGRPGEGSVTTSLAPYAHPLGLRLMDLFPTPNYSDPNNRYNYVFGGLEANNRWEGVVRLDYNITERHRAYLRAAVNQGTAEALRGIWWNSSSVELPTPIDKQTKSWSASLNMVSVLSPTTTNELLVTASKMHLPNDYADPSVMSLSQHGLGNWQGFFGRQVDVIPGMVDWSGQTDSRLYSQLGQHIFSKNDTYQIADNVTKIFNTHVVKAGLSLEMADKQQNGVNEESGLLSFGPGWTPGTTGSVFGDMLVGLPESVTQGTNIPDGSFRQYNIEWYLQDSWKVRRNITLEFGARFGYLTNNREVNGLGGIFDPTFYDRSKGTFVDAQHHLNGVRYASLGQVSNDLTPKRPILVMPRINFAWDIDGKANTVIRGGGGLFYNRPMGNVEYGAINLVPNSYQTKVGTWDVNGQYSGAGLNYDTLALIDPFARLGGMNVDTVAPDVDSFPRTASFSLSVARRLPFNQVLEVAYAGSLGRHLIYRRQTNVIPEGTLLKGTLGNADLSVPVNRMTLDSQVLTSIRPYPTLGNVQYEEFSGTSSYNSLQITLSRQTNKRFQYFVAYTFSKALGTSTNDYGPVDPFNIRNRSYGVLSYDRTHILNASYNWNIPDLARSNNGFLRGLLNGWQLSGISTLTSGAPMFLRLGGDIANADVAWWGTPDFPDPDGNSNATGPITPVYKGNPMLNGRKAGEKLLDINQLGLPAFGQSGGFQPPYYLRTPMRHNHDVTLFKNFALGGDKKLQFRLGAFNIFNLAFATTAIDANDIDRTLNTECLVHVNGVPNGAGGTSDNVCDPTGGYKFTDNTIANFGKINLRRGHRVIEVALKLYF